MKTAHENIAIYGGAFNPPTYAHEQVIQEVIQQTDITHIILSPSGEREDKNFGIEHMNRKKLIETFFYLLRKSGKNVSLDLHFFEGKNKSVTTTKAEEEYFRSILGFSPTFIFGCDTAENMKDWSNNENRFIEEKLKKIFISRPGVEFDFEVNGFREYCLLDIPHMLDISSSLARELIRTKQSVEGILHPQIAQEIHENNLYN